MLNPGGDPKIFSITPEDATAVVLEEGAMEGGGEERRGEKGVGLEEGGGGEEGMGKGGVGAEELLGEV